jgi:putative pyoverdin transport system ATP-binding/permease protein
MEFFRFLEKETKAFDKRLLAIACLAAVTNLVLLFTLTAAVRKATAHQSGFAELVTAVLAILFYWFSQGLVLRRTTVIVEEIVEKIRLRIGEKIRYSDLVSIENIGRAALYNAVAAHAANISRAATGAITAFTGLVFVCCAALIILFVSTTAFLILGGVVFFLFLLFEEYQIKSNLWLSKAVRQDNEFVQAFGGSIDGFKELKMSAPKASDFAEFSLKPLAAQAKEMRNKAGFALNRIVLIMTSSLFMVLAALVFLLPTLSPAEVPKLPTLATFVVFLFGPFSQVIGNLPFVTEATASIRELRRIEQRLDSIYEQGFADPVSASYPVLRFDTIRCSSLSFSYQDELGASTFSLESIEFQLSRGELVFITGGNGTGKSTFLKVLAGLYPPLRGTITVDRTEIDRENRQSYRHLFTTVLSDFHLFDRLYGIREIDHDRVRELLELTNLSHKTSIVGDKISSLNLSSGERKRLALVLSLLENTPILLLDEWAAEQDPIFRRKFYREILPWLKQQEKTVVAVTHDDDHYDVADRVLKMQFGTFI